MTIHWLGLSAVYTVQEREIMSTLPVAEQTVIHALKSLTAGTFTVPDGSHVEKERSALSERGGTRATPSEPDPTNFLDPDDIPFGEGTESSSGKTSSFRSNRRRIYAVVWTRMGSRQVRTKAIGTRKMRAWKRWYERQGWKVVNHATGYFARSPAGELHAILLHEYDHDTHERIA